MAALAVVPSPAVTAGPLYVIDDQLAALIETAEFRAEFQAALKRGSREARSGGSVPGAADRFCAV